MKRLHIVVVGISLILFGGFRCDSSAQELDLPDSDGSVPTGRPLSLGSVLKSEGQRYVTDSESVLLAPLHWDGSSWTQAAIAVASVGLLSQEDSRIDTAFQRNRSAQTNSFSSAVRPFGTYGAIGFSVVSLGAGLVFKNAEWRETGRDAIEAEILAAGIVTF
jgi:hypothetical protein